MEPGVQKTDILYKGPKDYPFDNESLPPVSEYFKKLTKLKQMWEQDLEFLNFDLIHPKDPDREVVEKILAEDTPKGDIKVSKAIGAFCGLTLGDSLGCFLEGFILDYERDYLKSFENVGDVIQKEQNGYLRCVPGQYTDDTSMSLCLADSLLVHNCTFDAVDTRYRFYQWWMNAMNNGMKNDVDGVQQSQGIGQALAKSIVQFQKQQGPQVEGCDGTGQINGNGSIMRLAPIPIAFSHDLDGCLKAAKEQSYTSHNGEEASECSRLLSFLCWHFLNSNSPDECKEIMDKKLPVEFKSPLYSLEMMAKSQKESEDKFKPDPYNQTVDDRNWNWKDPNFKYSPWRSKKNAILAGIYCMDATVMALHIVYHTTSFKEALLKAINLGGDADTVGAIVGMLAGFMYGYNEFLKDQYNKYIKKWDEGKAAIRAYKLIMLSQSKKVEERED